MLNPCLNCILYAKERYFWCVSVFYTSEQNLTFVEVKRNEVEKNEWQTDSWGKKKQVLKKSVNYELVRYINGLSVISYKRSEIIAKKRENVVKITDYWDMYISNEEETQILSKELLSYGKEKVRQA